MPWAADVLAQGLRLAGATLLTTAVFLSVLGERAIAPMRLAIIATVLLAAGCVALLLLTVAPFAARLDEPLLPLALEYLEQTPHGATLLLPLLPAMLALLLWQALAALDSPTVRRLVHWLLAATLLVLVALIAAGGHVATTRWEHVGMLVLVLHMACGISWVALVLSLLPQLLRGDVLGSTLARIGNAAAGMVIVLVIAGVFTAWMHNALPPWSLHDDYARLLLMKSLVLVLALAAAAYNRFHLLRLATGSEHLLRRVVAIEALLLVLALGLAAWLSRTPPPA